MQQQIQSQIVRDPVTNQAIQVLQGPYITNQYGGGVACQGPTANITPFITHSRGYKDPYESHYFEPQYDARDFEGRVVEVTRTVKNWTHGSHGITIRHTLIVLAMK